MTVDVISYIDEMNTVAASYIKGNDESTISRELDIPRARVVKLLNDWRNAITDNEAIRVRAKEALAVADTHYNHLIQQAYEVIEDSNLTSNLSSKTAAIKLIMDIEGRRIDMLQKAGLLENKELAEQLIETERKQTILVKILQDVVGTCDKCKFEVARRLTEVAASDEALVV